jgi:hypothetical protein
MKASRLASGSVVQVSDKRKEKRGKIKGRGELHILLFAEIVEVVVVVMVVAH